MGPILKQTLKTSATMAAVIDEAIRQGGELVLRAGGYWTAPNATTVLRLSPDLNCGTTTVSALIARGYATVLEKRGDRPIRVKITIPEV